MLLCTERELCLSPLHEWDEMMVSDQLLNRVKSGILLIVYRAVLNQSDDLLLSQVPVVLGKSFYGSKLLYVGWLCKCKSRENISSIF